MTTTQAHPIHTGGRGGKRRPNGVLIVIYLSLGGLAFACLQSLVAPALTTVQHDLNTTTDGASWILTAYLLSASVLTPILGRLGDIAGKRKIMIVVLALLFAGTLLAALAPNIGVLIGARALQGAAGAVLPLSIGIVRDELPHERVSVTIGLLSAIFGVGAGVGIVAAGPIVQNLNWHWLFWFPLILIGVALLGVIFGMPESPVRTPGRLDILGLVILTIALVSILLAISEGATWKWDDWKTLGLLVLGAIALIVFVVVELRVSSPLIDMRVFKVRGVWTSHFVALVFGFAMFGVFLVVPVILELPTALGYGFGKTVSEAGLYLLPTVVAMIICAPLTGALIRRVGPKPPMIIGGLVLTAAFLIPAISHTEIWEIVISGILTGAGIGFALSALSNAIVESVPATQTGEAISANTIWRSIGSSIGTAVIAAIIAGNSALIPQLQQSIPLDKAFTISFWVCAGVGVLATIGAIIAPSMKKRREQALAAGVTDFD